MQVIDNEFMEIHVRYLDTHNMVKHTNGIIIMLNLRLKATLKLSIPRQLLSIVMANDNLHSVNLVKINSSYSFTYKSSHQLKPNNAW